MAGFTFNGTASSTMNLVHGVPTIPILPQRNSSVIEIPGRDGTLDFGVDSYSTRIIPVECLVTASSEATLNGYLADIAVWLSGSGNLVFDQDTDKYWDAKVYTSIEPVRYPGIAIFTVYFECQPYAIAVSQTTGATIGVEDDYESDVIFYPQINVTLTDDAAYVQVALTSTGQVVRIEGSYSDEDEIVFDMSTGKVTVNDVSVMDEVTLASEFFGVPTGNQTITVTATSTFTADMDYYKRYMYA